MGFDDLKKFKGERYMGMPVGGRHVWLYPDGTWKEEKVNPSTWYFTFESLKKRKRAAPENSGAQINTEYHWYILASQKVKKVDWDTYETLMEGVKHKIAHKRPTWRKWSSEYPGNVPEQDRIMGILKDALAGLEKNEILRT